MNNAHTYIHAYPDDNDPIVFVYYKNKIISTLKNRRKKKKIITNYCIIYKNYRLMEQSLRKINYFI